MQKVQERVFGLSTSKSLTALALEANTYKGSWKNSKLAIDVDFALWERYDPDLKFVYPSRHSNWDDLLEKVIENNSYSKLTKDQTLNILFGLHHRNRVVEGLWFAMFEQGVSQKLLEQLLALEGE